MKKIISLVLLALIIAGCANKPLIDDYASYRGQTSAQIFKSGEVSLAKGNYDDAVKDFEALDALYPFGPNSRQGVIDSIYAYYQAEDEASALAAADRYLRLYPRGKHVDYVLYMKGYLNYNQGLTWLQKKLGVDPALRDLSAKKEAFATFYQLVSLYPKSPYAYSAYLKMLAIRNMIAAKNVDIAKFYYKRHAYVGAANRASFVVEHFGGTPAVINALVLMVKSYRALKLTEQVNNTLAILKKNYPDSAALRSALKS